ncbi:MAG: Uma2 family endonuclease [Acidobacteria bacterium]|jgi:Uma2 family endonuclease|nr:Uma2 family endonuclease [Acidobacteriota bacterium]
MGLAQQKTLYLPEEYLELERQAETRHEFVDGIIYAMAGESLSHSQICINLAGEVRAKLKGQSCQALSPNMKVRAEGKGMYAYPDLTIVCGKPLFHDEQRDVLLNPKVIIEVLSPSTQRYDQTKKFFRYRKELPSLTDYVLIYQDAPFIEHHEKQPDERWTHNAADGIDDVLRIPSVEIELNLREIYDRVEFKEISEEINFKNGISTKETQTL